MILNWLRRKPVEKKPIIYGRYKLKPVMGRALSVVTGYPLDKVVNMIASRQLSVNGTPLVLEEFSHRLEAGQYTITQTGGQTWQFFIQ